MRRKYLSRDDLRAILYSVIVDAALVLMVPVDQDAFVSDVRFAAPGAHWAGAFSSLCVDFVLAEASKMAERVARCNLARTTPVRLCDLGGPSAVLSRDQWAIACAIDGTRSVQDLAWQCGLALYDAIERVGGLVRAGVRDVRPGRDGRAGDERTGLGERQRAASGLGGHPARPAPPGPGRPAQAELGPPGPRRARRT